MRPPTTPKIAQRLAAGNEFPLAASRSAPMIFTSQEIARWSQPSRGSSPASIFQPRI